MHPAGPATPRHLFCFGCGYTAQRLARRLLAQGARVSGTARSPEGVQRLQGLGIEGCRFDGDAPVPAKALDGVTDILCSIPPGEGGEDGVIAAHGATLADLPTLRWCSLLSTTGVYGDVDGAWIDEYAPLRPGSERARRRVACEDRWLTWARAHGKAVQVFRLPGIYGPHRSPFARLRAGTARRIIKAHHVFNRIHVDDIASALQLAMEHPDAGPIFHLADEEPAPSDEVLTYAASLLGLPPPPATSIDADDVSPTAREFYAECKRLKTTRAKQALGFSPQFPSFREGLAAVLAE
ncbi:MAG: SDR family oxidoreductase, partial [Pseudomonadota bacterium]